MRGRRRADVTRQPVARTCARQARVQEAAKMRRHVSASRKGTISCDSSRHDARNDLTAMAPIYAEISVSRENNWFGNRFAHPNKTRISEAHWHICVLPHERKNLLDIGLQAERANRSEEHTSELQ